MDKILAFGDGENDLGMLEGVGWGVCMGNGMLSVRKALGLVDGEGEGSEKGRDGSEKGITGVQTSSGGGKYLTGTNDEGGVGMFLESVFGL